MSEQKHTPEPWRLHKHAYAGIESIQSRMIASCGSHSNNQDDGKSHRENEANAQRIVECVNALAGIENPAEWVKNMKLVDALDILEIAKINSDLQSENERLKAELAKLKGE